LDFELLFELKGKGKVQGFMRTFTFKTVWKVLVWEEENPLHTSHPTPFKFSPYNPIYKGNGLSPINVQSLPYLGNESRNTNRK